MQKQKKSNPSMLVTILGCGTSVGTPMIGLQKMKRFRNPKNNRLRASILIEPFGHGGPAILVDTSPDFRQQALLYFPQIKPRLDAVLLTHTHADHLHGLDDIRPFNFFQDGPIPLYAEPHALRELKLKFRYIFMPSYEGGGKPRLKLVPVSTATFRLRHCGDARLKKLSVTPLPLRHGSGSCLGFRIGAVAYVTDCSYIPDKTIEKMQDLEVLILDCVRPKPHSTHLHVDLAIQYAKRIGARRTVFTHMGNEIEYDEFRRTLPKNMMPAFDGMRLRISRAKQIRSL